MTSQTPDIEAGFERLRPTDIPNQPSYVESIVRRFKTDPLETANLALKKVVLGPNRLRQDERQWAAADQHIRSFSAANNHRLSVLQIGANDGLHNDPLRPYLKEFPDWSAVLVEPNPHAYQELSNLYAQRANITTIEAAVADADGTAMLYAAPFSLNGRPNPLQGKDSLRPGTLNKHLPGVNGADKLVVPVEVAAVSLETLINSSPLPKIDWLVVDTEGFDKAILDQLDLNRYQPQFILYEDVHMTSKEKTRTAERLQANGYRLRKLWRDTFAELA